MDSRAIDRRDVLRFRFRRHQLDREPDSAGSAGDVDLLDYGVQDTGPDGSAWALAVRGAPAAELRRGVDPPDELTIAWTLRGAPHAYRRRELTPVATATAPWSEADAAKRVFDAATGLRRGGLEVLPALRRLATTMRSVVTSPMSKGDVSRAVSDELGAPYVRPCRSCGTTHSYEQPFRLAALHAGLVLQPGTSPPVLERVKGFRAPGYRHLGDEAETRFDVVRNHLRFFGPSTVADVAGYLDAPTAEVKQHWPDDVVEVRVDGAKRVALDSDVADLADGGPDGGLVRLLGPFDPFLQLRDRKLLAPDASRRKDLWRTLGRPGAVVVDGEVLGTWRPKTAAKGLTLTVEPWRRLRRGERPKLDEQAERLAAFRDTRLVQVAVG